MKALGFLAGEGEALARFLTLSGLRPQDLRDHAADPFLLAAVLDFVLGEDEILCAFAEREGIDTKRLHDARRALPGAAPGA